MTTATTSTQAPTVNKRGPLSAAALSRLTAVGYTVRRGTGMYGSFPQFEWQLFDPDGGYVRPLPWRSVSAWGGAVRYDGINRRANRNRR